MLDFDPPANLEFVDYTNNCITRIDNVNRNKYLKVLNLDKNKISKIEGLHQNRSLTKVSLNQNEIRRIENLNDLMIEELYLSQNQITVISGLDKLRVLKSLDLSQNRIVKLIGLNMIESLRFLNLGLNQIEKILQLQYIENLPQLTELDLCFNPIQSKKYYRLQVLYHIPQLRMLDGQDITPVEKVKAENLHGNDLKDREVIFQTLLPEETFVDRRIEDINNIEEEEEDIITEEEKIMIHDLNLTMQYSEIARRYVGELI